LSHAFSFAVIIILRERSFDKQNWPDDARAFLDTCDQLGVFAAMERSRSGNGVHIWLDINFAY